MLTGLLLPLPYALFSVGGYILLGLIGAPVFAGGRSGLETLMGPTGGFIIGFIIILFPIHYLSKDIRYYTKGLRRRILYKKVALICVVATIILQSCGILWGKYYSGDPWEKIFDVWLNPFYFNMVFKIIITTLLSVEVWKEVEFKRNS